MGTTTPDNIAYPDPSTALNPLYTHFANLAETAQAAINNIRVAASPVVVSAAARNAVYPTPLQGNSVWRADLGYEERYFSEYSPTANPGGATPAGWYPADARPISASDFLTLGSGFTFDNSDPKYNLFRVGSRVTGYLRANKSGSPLGHGNTVANIKPQWLPLFPAPQPTVWSGGGMLATVGGGAVNAAGAINVLGDAGSRTIFEMNIDYLLNLGA